MHAVSQIASRVEPRVLVDNPDRRLGLVEALGPRYDGRVEGLDLGVEVADLDGDDLGDLWVG